MSLAYLSIISLSIIHVASGVRSSFLFGAEYSVLYIPHFIRSSVFHHHVFICLTVHLFIDTWVVYTFYLLYIMLLWMSVYKYSSLCFHSFGYTPTSECWIVVSLCLTFWESVQQLFQVLVSICPHLQLLFSLLKKVDNSHPRDMKILVISF